MDASAIGNFLDDPRHGWEYQPVGAFNYFVWPYQEPPRWQTATQILRESSSRAFLGLGRAGDRQHVKRALTAIEDVMRSWKMTAKQSPPTFVVLWDMLFPTPGEWKLPSLPETSCPVAVLPRNADDAILILLPTYDLGHFRHRYGNWLESAAIHEGFHALLANWIREAGQRRAVRSGWPKFEEMCAVALEVRLAPHASAWLDYAQNWQASLSLSHCHYSWSAFLSSDSSDFTQTVDREDYGHFALLAYLDEQFDPGRAGRHWLPEVWKAVRDGRTNAGPWQELDRIFAAEGGSSGLFLRYVQEALFPTNPAGMLAVLRRTLGPPAAAEITRRAAKKFFAIGPMSAQVLRLRTTRASGGGTLRIIDYKGLKNTVVLGFVSAGSSDAPPATVEVAAPRRSGNTLVWEIIFPDELPNRRYTFIVSQPDHAGWSLAFTAEWI